MKKNDLFKNIIAIRTAKNNSIICGTGFFVKTTEDKIYLVTAAHVAKDTTINTDIWLKDLNSGFPIFTKINQLNSMAMWLYHPISDIAILEVKGNAIDLTPYLLNINSFIDDFNKTPDRENTMTMYGIPDVYTDLKFAPFTCDCKPASDLWVSFFDETNSPFKCFMLDKPSTQGFSGGPVFSFEKNSEGEKVPICYGIIHGTRNDNTGGKLAIVVHSAYLFELIEYARSI